MLLDLIVLFIIILFVFINSKTGAIKSLMKIISFFGSAVLSLILFPLIQQTKTYELFLEKAEVFLQKQGVEFFTDQVASMVAGIVLAILLYLGSKLLLTVLSVLLEGVVQLPLLKQMNHLTGALLGLSEALVVIFGILVLLRLINASDLPVYHWIENSVLTRLFYEYNPLMLIFTGK